MWFSRFLANSAETIDKKRGWSKLPLLLAIPVLIGLRDRLRADNLYDTGRGPRDTPPFTDPARDDYHGARTLDGTYNDLDDPLMGSIGSRFGRNVPLSYTFPEEPPELLDPNPRLISRQLLTREKFQPASTLNLLAGAWIQFEVHDWFSHGDNDPTRPWEIPVESDDPWPDHPMQIDRTLPDPSTEPGKPATFTTARHPLVGRLAGLRQHAGVRRRAADARARQAEDRRAGPAARGRRAEHRPQGRRRQLLDRTRPAALAVHARAQRGLRPAARRVPADDRPAAVREGAARRRRADGEDPHGRLDAGDHRASDDRARHCGRTGTACSASTSTSSSAA